MGRQQQPQRQRGEDEQVGDGGELDVSDGAQLVRVQGVRTLHDGVDDEDERGADADVEGLEHDADAGMPANGWLLGAEDALGKDQVDDVDDEDAGVDKDIGGDGDAHILLVRSPYDAQDESDDPRHGETEQGA